MDAPIVGNAAHFDFRWKGEELPASKLYRQVRAAGPGSPERSNLDEVFWRKVRAKSRKNEIEPIIQVLAPWTSLNFPPSTLWQASGVLPHWLTCCTTGGTFFQVFFLDLFHYWNAFLPYINAHLSNLILNEFISWTLQLKMIFSSSELFLCCSPMQFTEYFFIALYYAYLSLCSSPFTRLWNQSVKALMLTTIYKKTVTAMDASLVLLSPLTEIQKFKIGLYPVFPKCGYGSLA